MSQSAQMATTTPPMNVCCVRLAARSVRLLMLILTVMGSTVRSVTPAESTITCWSIRRFARQTAQQPSSRDPTRICTTVGSVPQDAQSATTQLQTIVQSVEPITVRIIIWWMDRQPVCCSAQGVNTPRQQGICVWFVTPAVRTVLAWPPTAQSASSSMVLLSILTLVRVLPNAPLVSTGLSRQILPFQTDVNNAQQAALSVLVLAGQPAQPAGTTVFLTISWQIPQQFAWLSAQLVSSLSCPNTYASSASRLAFPATCHPQTVWIANQDSS